MSNASATSANRYFVGIDLGTTHTAVAYLDKSSGPDAPAQLFEIEQLVGPGLVAKRPLLPSFRYHPNDNELADSDCVLPWHNTNSGKLAGELNQVVIGEWARLLGSKVDGRLVASAKSWLSHHRVDRDADILPWGALETVSKVSPVFASASYLHHVAQAWNREFPDAPLVEQNIVITIPASFDEGARGLTVAAASMAGLDNILLLEEPQAVCYDWYKRNRSAAVNLLKNIPLLMVCDIGGGTTDLSLISATISNDKGVDTLALNRIGVGEHLMLGGDNIDLALAHVAEQMIRGQNSAKKLSAAALSQLIQQTRIAKEKLLAENPPESATVTLLGSGSRLIGGAKSCLLSQQQVKAIALDGFFPATELTEKPQQSRTGLLEFGLPYAFDAAIPKHLAEFLVNHQTAMAAACPDHSEQTLLPQALLLNGGVFNSALIKQRVLSQFNAWHSAAGNVQEIVELENTNPNLSVAFGAVAYAQACRDKSLKIGGGSARSFFLKLEDGDQAICLLSKGCDEELDVSLGDKIFSLTLGQPVRFSLLSSAQDKQFNVGEIYPVNAENFIELPPLVMAVGREQSQDIQVTLVSRLSEVGVLQLSCVAVADNSERWSLEFQVRKSVDSVPANSDDAINPEKLNEALTLIDSAYSANKKSASEKNTGSNGGKNSNPIKTLRPSLEKLLGERSSWSADVSRHLFDQFLQVLPNRRRSEAHEQNWHRLAGFSLRPGFGCELDDWRIDQVWPLYEQGMQFNKTVQAWGDWWTFWRRVSGGLNQAQQKIIYNDIALYLHAESIGKRKITEQASQKSYEDMVLLAASLENLCEDDKIDLANGLLERCLHGKGSANKAVSKNIKKGAKNNSKADSDQGHWWAIGRVCSRSPFYGSQHNVLDAEDVSGLLEHLLQLDWKADRNIAFAAVMMSRRCGDRSRDIDDAERQKVIEKLNSIKAPSSWIEMVAEVKVLDDVESKKIYGDGLPPGLKLI